jgi:sortase A
MSPHENNHKPHKSGADDNGREEAVHLMRAQVEREYDQHNPYDRTHDQQAIHADSGEQLKAYHSAWQKYYQQYYHRYYAQQLEQKLAEQKENQISEDRDQRSEAAGPAEFKNELLEKVMRRAGKFQKSAHFWPIVSALVVGLVVIFAQYNRVFIANIQTYISPGSIETQNIILDPTTNLKVGPEPKLIIPKINVDAPVVYNVGTLQEGPIQNALKGGVVHYPLPGASSIPGQIGNTVILGHSSNDVFDAGNYKFVFVLLDRLQKGDTFYINYNGTRYTYTVTAKEIIAPTEVNKLVVQTDRPVATLVTCTPPGTALKRLVVTAEQVSPDPVKAAAAPTIDSNASNSASIPGNSPTFFERLFGAD